MGTRLWVGKARGELLTAPRIPVHLPFDQLPVLAEQRLGGLAERAALRQTEGVGVGARQARGVTEQRAKQLGDRPLLVLLELRVRDRYGRGPASNQSQSASSRYSTPMLFSFGC